MKRRVRAHVYAALQAAAATLVSMPVLSLPASQRTTTEGATLCEVGLAEPVASHGLLPWPPTQRTGHTASRGQDSLQCIAASRELATVFAHGYCRDPPPQRSACQ